MGQSKWPSTRSRPSHRRIKSIAYPLRATVYGLSGDRTQVYTITWNDGATPGGNLLANCSTCAAGAGATTYLNGNTSNATVFPYGINNLNGMLWGLHPIPSPQAGLKG